MADNVAITAGSGTTIASDDIGGVQYQRVKLVVGADGVAADLAPGQAAMAASVPVAIASNQSAVPVTNAGTFATQVDGAALTALQLIDNCISGSEAQVDIVAALPAGDNNIGNVDIVTLPALAAGTNNIGDVDVLTLPALPAGNNNIGDVDIASIAAGDNNIGNVDIVSLPASTNTIEVVGDAAHDAAVAGNPVRVGGFAANVIPAAVANADTANIITDLHGRVITVPFAPPEKWQQYTSPSDITDTADDEAFAAVASVRHFITHFSVMCSHATTGTWVYIKDGSTVIFSAYCAPAGGGGAFTFPTPLAGTANTAINVANATTSSATRVNVVGYQAP